MAVLSVLTRPLSVVLVEVEEEEALGVDAEEGTVDNVAVEEVTGVEDMVSYIIGS